MKSLTFYNSLTKQKEPFTPLDPTNVGLYSCGLTVYDRGHIGNFRSFLMADLLRRVVQEVGGYPVSWVMNITDIDDKMIIRANNRRSDLIPIDALHHLAHEYENKLLEDLERVGIHRSDIKELPRATDHIVEMQAIIRHLLRDGIAYISEGSIYFSLSKYEAAGKKYGQLVNIDYDPQARIDDQDQKEGAGDFALWKKAQPDEPTWDFDIHGENIPGRPGWHIECSAMSTKYLGREFDLHTGGIDLKFPHHENEIAQCGGVLARYWLHNEHLHINGEKMAKSLKNFYTLEDVAAIGSPLAYRLLVLGSHYRSQMEYSDEGLAEAEGRLKNLREWVSKVINNTSDNAAPAKVGLFTDAFDAALADDLGTPAALAVLAEAERSNIYGDEMREFVAHVDATLGLQLLVANEVLNEADIEDTLQKRKAARESKDFSTSDALRDSLKERGIGVEDTSRGQVIWRLS